MKTPTTNPEEPKKETHPISPDKAKKGGRVRKKGKSGLFTCHDM
jgi:hypothetical protein